MQKPQYHLLVCNSFRMNGDPQGSCNRKGAPSLLQYLYDGINDRGLDAAVATTSCMNICEKGPILVVYPQAWWYSEVTEEKIDEILDCLEQNQPAETLLMV
jgi:(2Fe-2S) ferredoxin